MARALATLGWKPERVEGDNTPDDGPIYRISEHPKLKNLVNEVARREMDMKRGEWRVTRPAGSTAVYRYGYDMRTPQIVTDYDVVLKFMRDGFDVVELSAELVKPEVAPEPLPTAAPVVEGADVARKRGGPMTTHAMPKRHEI